MYTYKPVTAITKLSTKLGPIVTSMGKKIAKVDFATSSRISTFLRSVLLFIPTVAQVKDSTFLNALQNQVRVGTFQLYTFLKLFSITGYHSLLPSPVPMDPSATLVGQCECWWGEVSEMNGAWLGPSMTWVFVWSWLGLTPGGIGPVHTQHVPHSCIPVPSIITVLYYSLL